MRSSFFSLASAFASCAVAQNREDFFPECSLKCLDDATRKATDCSTDDAACMCIQKNYQAIYSAGVSCVLQACSPSESISQVVPAGDKFCAAAAASQENTAGGSASSSRAPGAQATSSFSGGAATTDAPGHMLSLAVAGLFLAAL